MSRSINLYNPALRKRKLLFSALHMVQGLLLVFVGTLLLYAYIIRMEKDLITQEADLEAAFKGEQVQADRLASELRIKAASHVVPGDLQTREHQLQNHRALFLAISEGIARQHGYAQYLRAFARQNVEGLWLTGFSIDARGDHIRIHGRTLHAELIPRYLTRLSQEPALQGKHFAALDIRPTVGNTAPDQVHTVDFDLDSLEGEKSDPPKAGEGEKPKDPMGALQKWTH